MRYECDEDCVDPPSLKSNVAEFTTMVERFMAKINANPLFHQEITYRENNADLCEKYLSSTELMNDLKVLLEVMNVYRKNGIDTFEITYG